LELEAHRSGKKLKCDAYEVDSWVRLGVGPEEFVGLAPDVEAYFLALRSERDGDLDSAERFARRAVAIAPGAMGYFDLLSKIRVRRGDLAAIAEAVEFYADDIDAFLVHLSCERWLGELTNAGRYEECAVIILRINTLLDDIIGKRRRHRRFTSTTPRACRAEKDSFNKGLSKATFPGRTRIGLEKLDAGLRLVELVRQLERPENPGFLERVGDSCAEAGRAAESKKYYAAAMEAASAGAQSAAGLKRVQRKLREAMGPS
jgi:hypothetical protein